MDNVKKNILIVDDEEQNLRAIRRAFIQSEFNIFLANSGQDALKILDNNKIDMIISDIRMPGLDGYQLLLIVKEKYPSVIRIILSGYVDEDLVFKAIQNGLAKMYLVKPWDNQELIRNITRIFELKSELRNEKMMNIINNLNGLPTIMEIYSELISYIENDVDIKKISKLIEKDQSISARVLQVANSAYYGVKTGSIHRAIIYLGLANIKNIVLTASIFNNSNFMINSIQSKSFFWKHASLTNKIMIFLYYELIGKKIPDTYAASGLLHDIGKIALIDCLGKYKSNYGERKINSILDIEEYMGITHEELGACLLEWWEIPLPIVESALYHHRPFSNKIINKELVCLVHLSDYYSLQLQKRGTFSKLDYEVFDFLGFNKMYCDDLIFRNMRELLVEEGGEELHIKY